jgi:predicted pyridoxine 5'-phosphate oxidase superfamily flavin-nucleotide-binding protein
MRPRRVPWREGYDTFGYMALGSWLRSVLLAPPVPRPELTPPTPLALPPGAPTVPAPRADLGSDGTPLSHPDGTSPTHPGITSPSIPAEAPSLSTDAATVPGSRGERQLQCAYGSEERAARFYADQVRDRLLPAMIDFVARMEMVFVATSDGGGECDASLRAGPPGFVQVLDERHLAYPEYRGNGVHASLGNITENPHVGLLMVDFVRDVIGLHVNGRARIVDDAELRADYPGLPEDAAPGRRAARWVLVTVTEAYIHCRKHIPRMAKVSEQRAWGTDDPASKGGDYFGARAERLAREAG